MTVKTPCSIKIIPQPITPGAASCMQQHDKPIRIPSNFTPFLPPPQKKEQKTKTNNVEGVIGLGYASHWFKNYHKCSNHNRIITFDSHLKTAT